MHYLDSIIHVLVQNKIDSLRLIFSTINRVLSKFSTSKHALVFLKTVE